eukprot:Gregarina_sp_Pseudo_9__2925@NODE_313_length_3190_cov_36_799429_g294_i0_p1_GENE_NODE_313_length_3190_cov_36_799429_g294_i0NODE_313_length_3190_cov_36_799429_g294_i0_p1_ORF_typecomplete_len519_score136_41Peptidase_C97/PF05903_14/1_8e25LRAT/PF04970_13/0_051LRAT/PF04970_13/1_9e03_NODE_313_length_3190_cov_36_799429_g294_i0681624
MHRPSPRMPTQRLQPFTYPPPDAPKDMVPVSPTQVPSRLSVRNSHPVALRIYDLSNGKVAKLTPFLMRQPIRGLWHTAIMVYGNEYFYSDSICKLPPEVVEKELKMSPVAVENLGNTKVSQREFECFLTSVRGRFTREAYRLLDWNCNHFSNICSRFLLEGREIPEEIQNLSRQVEGSVVGRMALMWLLDKNQEGALERPAQHLRTLSTTKSLRGLSAMPRRTATMHADADDASLIVHSPPRRFHEVHRHTRRDTLTRDAADTATTRDTTANRDTAGNRDMTGHGRDAAAHKEATLNRDAAQQQAQHRVTLQRDATRRARESVKRRTPGANPSPRRDAPLPSPSRGTLQTHRSHSPVVSPVTSARERVASGVTHLVSIRDSDGELSPTAASKQSPSPWRHVLHRATSHVVLTQPPERPPPLRILSCDDSTSQLHSVSVVSALAPPPTDARWPSRSRAVASPSRLRTVRPSPSQARASPSLMDILRPSPLATSKMLPNFATADVLQGVSILSAYRKVAS